MNVLEQYITEIHSEVIVEEPWMNEKHVKADITINCHGHVTRHVRMFPISYWEEAKEKGYYMG